MKGKYELRRIKAQLVEAEGKIDALHRTIKQQTDLNVSLMREQMSRPVIRQTHTYAVLDVPKEMFDLVADKLRAAGYDHAFVDEHIDMHGIALGVEGE